jgi:hypothetical protein
MVCRKVKIPECLRAAWQDFDGQTDRIRSAASTRNDFVPAFPGNKLLPRPQLWRQRQAPHAHTIPNRCGLLPSPRLVCCGCTLAFVATMRFLHLIRPVMCVLPEVASPDRKVCGSTCLPTRRRLARCRDSRWENRTQNRTFS